MAIFRSCSNVSDRFLLREQQVMLQATGGKMNKQVANEQGISEITVEKSSRPSKSSSSGSYRPMKVTRGAGMAGAASRFARSLKGVLDDVFHLSSSSRNGTTVRLKAL
jgi:FixJ family two-component response regulator